MQNITDFLKAAFLRATTTPVIEDSAFSKPYTAIPALNGGQQPYIDIIRDKDITRAPVSKQGPPLTLVMVMAPLITDVSTEDGVRPLLDLVESLSWNSNTAVARAEGIRIGDYIEKMSGYLQSEVETLPNSDAKEDLRKLTTPEALSDIFYAMAVKTRNTMLSDVVVAPSGIRNNTTASHLFKGNEFKVGYSYNRHRFNFGFIQVHAAPQLGQRFTTIIPIFLLDQDMMDAAAPHAPQALLKGFQSLMTFVNHDMMHHFTLPAINKDTAKKFLAGYTSTPSYQWFEALPARPGIFGRTPLYEEWAQMAHEKTLLFKNDAVTREVCAVLDDYFAELKRIGNAIQQGASPETGPDGKSQAHAVVDYFGTMMAHALTRVFPLNHPVMAHCLERLKDADPMPEKILVECHRSILPGPYSFDNETETIARIVQYGHYNKKTTDILEAYQDIGLHILRPDMGYRELKLLQLIRLSGDDVHPHAPSPRHQIKELRDNIGYQTLRMVVAAAQTVGYQPR